jgi:hypothetical protein
MRKITPGSLGGFRPVAALAVGCTLLSPLSLQSQDAGVAPSYAAERPAARVLELAESNTALPARALFGASLSAAGRFLIVSGTGLALHRTSQPISALRTLFIPGSTVELYTWEETAADGHRAPFYAYSRDGGTLLGRVVETSYRVRLQDLEFDPLKEGQPGVSNFLAAPSDGNLHLVQFHATPLPQFRQTIIESGGKVLRFLSDHTFLVEMNAATRASVAQLPYVRWVGPYHPEYRLERVLRESLQGLSLRQPEQRYSIMLGEGGGARQAQLAAHVERLGGKVELIESGGMRIEATLTSEQLTQLVRDDAVQFIDRWGGPGELDMDIVREVGGATSLETIRGWSGHGVRGEVFDTEVLTNHREWGPPILHSAKASSGSLHGSSCYSINFAQGIDGAAKGMIPSAQGIFFLYTESAQFGGPKSRYDMNKELVDPAGPYRAVFQTSSVGSTLGTTYTTISAEVDDYLFKIPLLSTQSQSNAGSPSSRPQAWAKNIVSVGAVRHYNTASRGDDRWNRSGSTGPAADGRVKPDLAHFFDSIHSAAGNGTKRYTEFGGTSAATPITAGHFGLLFQMWHQGVWAGHGKKSDVFSSRPQMATAKALMINMAWRYDWKAGGNNGDIDRFKQGYGTADVQRLLDRAPVTSVVDETDVLLPLGSKSYDIKVDPGQSELNVTMAYKDPMGTVGAARARVNDLSLRVTSPTGKVYWGNNGLTAGNYSTEGGASNKIDTVENVFIKMPEPGNWKIEVMGDEIVQDGNPATSAIDAVYGLVVSGGLIQIRM